MRVDPLFYQAVRHLKAQTLDSINKSNGFHFQDLELSDKIISKMMAQIYFDLINTNLIKHRPQIIWDIKLSDELKKAIMNKPIR